MIHQAVYAAGIQNIRLHRPPSYYGQHLGPKTRCRASRSPGMLALNSFTSKVRMVACEVLLDIRTYRKYNWFALSGAQNAPGLPANSGKMPPLSPP
jgi:hypothetical protein